MWEPCPGVAVRRRRGSPFTAWLISHPKFSGGDRIQLLDACHHIEQRGRRLGKSYTRYVAPRQSTCLKSRVRHAFSVRYPAPVLDVGDMCQRIGRLTSACLTHAPPLALRMPRSRGPAPDGMTFASCFAFPRSANPPAASIRRSEAALSMASGHPVCPVAHTRRRSGFAPPRIAHEDQEMDWIDSEGRAEPLATLATRQVRLPRRLSWQLEP